jgi:succinate dehydrogenase / fumarate reductase membrane anchor subunit
MKESRLMQLQYVTAVAALVLVSFHLLMQGVLVPYGEALNFQHVLSLYRDWVDGSLLEILLVVVLLHGFNGLRMILIEWRQTSRWTAWVNGSIVIAAVVAIAYGTRTVLFAVFGGVG